ncbi:penicillin-binding protein activator LpoB [Sphingobium sufflavum]|uniref:CsgG/HfaB family protein n=1 Tax=Sphingobium sufflavum TaxID=1129547 RepID=UPI001F28B97E|nr:CsgG/HfaB family protein [Sphingobium sufflavum]MCE7796113.1 penicillin-binding protein activator LpoB [Sphingobium sufflavum]
MRKFVSLVALASMLAPLGAPVAFAADKGSSAHQKQQKGEAEIPVCTRRLGTVAIVEPDNQWWREFNLGSPEAIIKIFVQKSGCFGIVNRGRSLQSRNLERAMADSGELQRGSNLGKGQVKAADYFLQPDIVTANRNSGGGGIGGVLGGFMGGTLGALAGAISVKKGEAKTTLSIVNARTTEEEAMTEGYARKSDISFGGGGGLFGGGAFGAAGAGGYQDTAIGQIIVLSYLDAYTKLVTQLGGLPVNAAAAAPKATK